MRTFDSRPWWNLADAILKLPPLMPEGVFWHDDVFAVARICCILFILSNLNVMLIPQLRRYG